MSYAIIVYKYFHVIVLIDIFLVNHFVGHLTVFSLLCVWSCCIYSACINANIHFVDETGCCVRCSIDLSC